MWAVLMHLAKLLEVVGILREIHIPLSASWAFLTEYTKEKRSFAGHIYLNWAQRCKKSLNLPLGYYNIFEECVEILDKKNRSCHLLGDNSFDRRKVESNSLFHISFDLLQKLLCHLEFLAFFLSDSDGFISKLICLPGLAGFEKQASI